MCTPDCDSEKEIAKLPDLIAAKGWSCAGVRKLRESDDHSYLIGSSGPIEGGDGPNDIRVMTGITFSVTAREEDLKVRVGWPGQMNTTYTCFSAEQVMYWLSKFIPFVEKDLEETKAQIKAAREAREKEKQ